jgi:hypothetical protein
VRVTQPAAPQRALAGTSLSRCQRAGDAPRVRRAPGPFVERLVGERTGRRGLKELSGLPASFGPKAQRVAGRPPAQRGIGRLRVRSGLPTSVRWAVLPG